MHEREGGRRPTHCRTYSTHDSAVAVVSLRAWGVQHARGCFFRNALEVVGALINASRQDVLAGENERVDIVQDVLIAEWRPVVVPRVEHNLEKVVVRLGSAIANSTWPHRDHHPADDVSAAPIHSPVER